MAKRKPAAKPAPKPEPPPDLSAPVTKPARSVQKSPGWEKERQRSAATQAAKSQAGRDIFADFPAVVDPVRRAKARESLEYFCKTYYPLTFVLPWSKDHLKGIGRIEAAVKNGGLFAYAMPRGSGKTSLAETAVQWAALFGYRTFPVLIGSDESSALELLESIKSELENNDLLAEDFPEVCHSIRRLEGISHRANGQIVARRLLCGECATEWDAWQSTPEGLVSPVRQCPGCEGTDFEVLVADRTHVYWSAKEIVFPTIPGSLSSGAIIATTGITGPSRGMM